MKTTEDMKTIMEDRLEVLKEKRGIFFKKYHQLACQLIDMGRLMKTEAKELMETPNASDDVLVDIFSKGKVDQSLLKQIAEKEQELFSLSIRIQELNSLLEAMNQGRMS